MQTQLTTLIHPSQGPSVLTALIDELGTLRAQLKTLEAHEKALAESVKALLARNGGRADGQRYHATLYQQERLTVDPTAYADLVNEPAFFNSLTINVAQARQYLGEAALKAVSTVQVVDGLRVEPKTAYQRRSSGSPSPPGDQ